MNKIILSLVLCANLCFGQKGSPDFNALSPKAGVQSGVDGHMSVSGALGFSEIESVVKTGEEFSINSEFYADYKEEDLSLMYFVNVQQFGANPYDDVDDTQAVQNAIDAAFKDLKMRIFFPPFSKGKGYKISRVKFPSHFNAWKVRGGGFSDNVTEEETTTTIIATNKSGPCFDIGAVRQMDLEGLDFRGPIEQRVRDVVGAMGDTAVWKPEHWVPSGYDMSRYNAQSAIAFDYNAPKAPWSAQVYIRRVKITGFVVGINISPSDGNLQADTYKVEDSKLENCVYGISIGQDQCRSIVFDNIWMNQIYCAYTNNQFGRGNGSAFNVTNGQLTNVFKIFQCTSAYLGQCNISGLFTEACGVIGAWQGLGCNLNSVVFTGCQFGLDDDYWQSGKDGVWVTPVTTMEVGSNTLFSGCNFNSRKEMLAFHGNRYTFDNCQFRFTRKLFFSIPSEVEIRRNATYLCDGPLIDISDHPSVTRHNSKTYVRPEARSIWIFGGDQPSETQLLKKYVPNWYNVAFRDLPKTTAREFDWELSVEESAAVMVGDYLNGYAIPTTKIPGMALNFAEVQCPAYQVLSKNGNTVRLRRTGPEIRSFGGGRDFKSGGVLTAFHTFYAAKEIAVQGSGNSVSVKNGTLLAAGDMVSINGQPNRVLKVGGDKVTFHQTVSQGVVKSISQ